MSKRQLNDSGRTDTDGCSSHDPCGCVRTCADAWATCLSWMPHVLCPSEACSASPRWLTIEAATGCLPDSVLPAPSFCAMLRHALLSCLSPLSPRLPAPLRPGNTGCCCISGRRAARPGVSMASSRGVALLAAGAPAAVLRPGKSSLGGWTGGREAMFACEHKKQPAGRPDP